MARERLLIAILASIRITLSDSRFSDCFVSRMDYFVAVLRDKPELATASFGAGVDLVVSAVLVSKRLLDLLILA